MNYGPLAQAIEQLLHVHSQRPPKKDNEGTTEYNVKINNAWLAIQEAQDAFYNDVKAGRIEMSKYDER